MIITISGVPGSGKSTAGKSVARKLGYEYVSMGDFRGKMAMERGLTIDELNKLGEKEDWTDRQADEYQRELGKTKDNLVVEGRLSWHFIPRSFKVFLTVDSEEAAQRTLRNPEDRPDEKPAANLAEAKEAVEQRLASDKKRYLQHYGLDYTDPKNYDLVIDTSTIPAKQVVQKILDKINSEV